MLIGHLALVAAALFTGAALYVGFAEQPARLQLDDQGALRQWKPSYARGTVMQASLVVVGGALGLLAGWLGSDWRWVFGACFMLANLPYTMLALLPINRQLGAMAAPDESSRRLIERWGRLHALRTLLGVLATASYLWTLTG